MFTDEVLTAIEEWLSKNRSVYFVVTKSDTAIQKPIIGLSIIKRTADFTEIKSLLSVDDYKMFIHAIATTEQNIYGNLTKDPCMAALIQAEIDEVWECSQYNCKLLQAQLDKLLDTALAKQLICNSVGPNW